MGQNIKENHLLLQVQKFRSEVADIYIFLLLVIFPLYVKGGYSLLYYNKMLFLLISTVILLVVNIAASIWAHLKKAREQIRLSSLDCIMLFYVLCVFLSFFGAADKKQAFWGVPTWNMGLAAQILFVAVYFIISRNYSRNSKIEFCAGITYSVVCGILFLQRLGIDVFWLYKGFKDSVRINFVSTLGQVTWGSVYITVILVFCIGQFLYETQLQKRLYQGGLIAIGCAAVSIQNCDSAIFAMIGVIIYFFWKALENKQAMIRFLDFIQIGLLSVAFVGIMEKLFYERLIPIDAIYQKTAQSYYIYVIFAVVTLLKIFLKKKKIQILTLKGRKIIFLFLFVSGAAILVSSVILHTIGIFPNSPFNPYFAFNDWWGNSRGIIWRTGFSVFGEFNVWQKLFGGGPDSFSYYAYEWMGNILNTFWNKQFVPNAHNEWLNGYINYGIIGGSAYIGIFLIAIRQCLHKKNTHQLNISGKYQSESHQMIPFICAMIAYMLHNFFCYQQLIGTSIIFIIIGIAESMNRQFGVKSQVNSGLTME